MYFFKELIIFRLFFVIRLLHADSVFILHFVIFVLHQLFNLWGLLLKLLSYIDGFVNEHLLFLFENFFLVCVICPCVFDEGFFLVWSDIDEVRLVDLIYKYFAAEFENLLVVKELNEWYDLVDHILSKALSILFEQFETKLILFFSWDVVGLPFNDILRVNSCQDFGSLEKSFILNVCLFILYEKNSFQFIVDINYIFYHFDCLPDWVLSTA